MKKNEKKPYTFDIEIELIEQIDQICNSGMYKRGGIINCAIREYLKNNKNKF